MILFQSIKYKNLLSSGNTWTTIQLDECSSTIIVGENGAGKSTLLDALSFGLYGKPFRKINKPQLVNSINKKDMMVEVVFRSGADSYIIKRGIKPNVFQIFKNDVMMNQSSATKDQQAFLEENILKMNHKSFGQIVILGSTSFVPFMQLTAATRREIIEDLLDIQIFSTMNTLLKSDVSENKNAIIDVKHNLDMAEQKKETASKYQKEIKTAHNEQQKLLENKINLRNDIIEKSLQKKENIKVQLNAVLIDDSTQKDVKRKNEELVDFRAKLNNVFKGLQTDISFFSSNDKCPTCFQPIDADFKNDRLKTWNEKKAKVDEALSAVKNKLDKVESQIHHFEDNNRKAQSFLMQMNEEESTSRMAAKDIVSLRDEIKKLSQKQNIQIYDIDEIQTDIDKFTKKYQSLIESKSLLLTSALLLQDKGIKAQIVKQYIPVINQLVNKYLQTMGLFVQFELDEMFNEKIKSRYRDAFSYTSFSEGEKMRIDLALLFTWRNISRMRNSVSTNILIMDEIMDSSLDANGQQDFVQILKELTKDMNVFIISHKTDAILEQFDRKILFTKQKNFSSIQEKE